MIVETSIKCLRVVLVGGQAEDPELFRQAFEPSSLACETTVCRGGEEALAATRNQPGEFDLVVSEYRLPDMTGLDLWGRMSQDEVFPPLMLLTASGTERLAVQALKAGVAHYLVKDGEGRYLDELPQVCLQVVDEERARLKRRRIEDEFEKTHAWYRALLNAVPDLILRQDRDGTYLDFIPSKDWPPHVPPSEFLGKKVEQVLPPDLAQEARGLIEAALETGHAQSFEYDLSTAEEKRSYEARIAGCSSDEVLAIIRDVTARKQAEEALRLVVEGTSWATGEEFFRSLVKHLAEALRVRCAFVSELVDRRAEKVRLLAMWDKNNYAKSFEYATAGTPCEHVVGKQLAFYPARVVDLFPQDEWLREASIESYLAVPFFDSTGRSLGHLGVMHDGPMEEGLPAPSLLRIFAARAATELERKCLQEALEKANLALEKRVEERTQLLQQAQNELLRKERLAVLGQLAGGVSHDLRGPLAVLRNSTYYLRMVHGATDEKTREHLDIMEREISHCHEIIFNLLDFASIKPPRSRLLDLGRVLREQIREVSVPETVRVVEDHSPDLPLVRLDRSQLRQILTNLLTNALEAMPDGGTLTLKTKNDEASVTVSITDTGEGIPPQALDKLFHPLYTTKPTGVGLGTMVAKSLVEANHGVISFDSTVGEGTTCHLRFPVDDGPPQEEE